MPESLYRYIWSVNPRGQTRLILLTLLVFPLTMVPLELQRRIVDDAVRAEDFGLLLNLGAVYLGVLLLHGGLKYLMNMQRGRTIQHAKNHLRQGVYYCIYAVIPPSHWRRNGEQAVDHGTVVSMLSAEVEKLGEFVGESFSQPILQGGTMIVVLGYMIWVEPVVALMGLAVYTPQMVIIPLLQKRINAYDQEYSGQVRDLGDFVVHDAEDRDKKREADHQVPEEFVGLLEGMFLNKMRALRLKFMMKFGRNLINALGPLSILVIGGWYVIRGETEIGTIVAFLSGFEKISGPWTELIGFYRKVSNARMKYAMLVDTVPDPPADARPVPQPRVP